MLDKKILGLLNLQLNREYYSSYLYLSMAAYCDSLSFVGFANWFRVQSQEELDHAGKFFDHITVRQARVKLTEIEEPPFNFKSVLDVFEEALSHEQKITKWINEIYSAAEKEHDHATKQFLAWFIDEQVEEEASAQLMVDKLRMIGESKGSLLYLDKEAKKRQRATSPA